MAFHRPRLLVLFTAALIIASGCAADENSSADAAEDPAPTGATDPGSADPPTAFIADRLDGGGEFDAAVLEGRNTVLWFWAPWCTTCRAEAPDVVQAAAEFEGSVEVIGVAGRGDVDAMQDFVEQTGTGGLDHIIDDDGSIWTQYGVAAQPAFAFIDHSGEVDVFVGTLGSTGLTERMQTLAAD